MKTLKEKLRMTAECMLHMSPEQNSEITKILCGVPEVTAIKTEVDFAFASINNHVGQIFCWAVFEQQGFEVEIGEFLFIGNKCELALGKPKVRPIDNGCAIVQSDGKNVTQVIGGNISAEDVGWDGSKNIDKYQIALNVLKNLPDDQRKTLFEGVQRFIVGGIELGNFKQGDNMKIGIGKAEDGTPWLVVDITDKGEVVQSGIMVAPFQFELVPVGEKSVSKPVKNDVGELRSLAAAIGCKMPRIGKVH